MKIIHLNGLLIAAAVLTLSSAACADLTETVTTRISTTSITGKANASLKALQAAGLLSQLSTSTIYKSGDKIKMVLVGRSQTIITISDLGSSTIAVLFPTNKTEMVSPDRSFLTSSIPSAKVIDTKQSKMILGHKAHLFKFSLNGAGITRTGDAWIAADISAPPQSQSFVPVIVDAPSLSHQFPEMRGTWLKASVVSVSSGSNMPGSNMKVSAFYEVTALSNAPIPASAFDIPQGYTTTDYTKTPPKAPPAGVPD